MYYIISSGGKQYLVSPGQKLNVEKIDSPVGGEVVFDKVLMTIDGNDVKIGRPYLDGVSISASVVEQGRDKKKIVFRYHSKTRYRKKKGHRQPFTSVTIK